jgi:hypothetical protein
MAKMVLCNAKTEINTFMKKLYNSSIKLRVKETDINNIKQTSIDQSRLSKLRKTFPSKLTAEITLKFGKKSFTSCQTLKTSWVDHNDN